MSQSDWFDNHNNENEVNTASDVHEAESSADIYNTPDVTGSPSTDVPAEGIPAVDVVVESTPAEEAAYADTVVPYNNPYGNAVNSGQMPPSGNQGNGAYNGGSYNNNPYGSNHYDNNPYGYNPYGGQMQPNGNQGNGTYNSNQYNNSPYNNNPYANNQYGNNQYTNNQYGNDQYTNNQYGNNQYTNNQYGNNQYTNNQYGNNQYGNYQYGNGPSGMPPYGNDPYSPYAVPPKKNKTGLIIGIVIAIIVLFLIAIFALVYKTMSIFEEDRSRTRSSRNEYNFDDDDDWRTERNPGGRDKKDDDYDDDDDWYDDYDDWYDDYDYDDWYDYYDDYDYDDDEYYTFHNDIKTNLSYSVDMETYEYDTDYDNVYIVVDYPVISGENVPNLDKLNEAIREEVEVFTEFFEDGYEEYINDEDNFFSAYSMGYVTYMDEEIMSIVFEEYVYSGYYDDFYVYCINIDMEKGVILDNENILSIDDDFSVDFRKRSDIQNGEISFLTRMTDQEITHHFNSSDIIVCYTPMGMEIGFNYDQGWVTVTYEEYEQYLKVF